MIGNETDGGIVPLTMKNIFHAIENLDEERNFLLGYVLIILTVSLNHKNTQL